MDSDWVFNFDCNQKPTNIDSFFDLNIIPLVFYQSVLNRNKKEVYEVIKNNPRLVKEIIKFFQHNLAQSFYFKKKSDFHFNCLLEKIDYRFFNCSKNH